MIVGGSTRITDLDEAVNTNSKSLFGDECVSMVF